MLRWLKTVVVSDVEKAPGRCQVGTRKMSEPEPLWTCRYKSEVASKPWPCLGLREQGLVGRGSAKSGLGALTCGFAVVRV